MAIMPMAVWKMPKLESLMIFYFLQTCAGIKK
jgi:hypothetical protein